MEAVIHKSKIITVMKPSGKQFSLATAACLGMLAFLVAFRLPVPALTGDDKWEKLGEHKVTLDVQSGTFNFPENSPVLSAIKIKSKKGAINLQRCMIYFANGDKKSIELRNDIPPGGESRVIQLPGNKQPVTRFVFWYGSSQTGADKAEIEIWGRI